MSARTNSDGIATRLRETADAIGHLVAGHLKLARLELMSDVSAVGQRAAVAVCFATLAAIGYVFIALGIAALLHPILGWAAALLIVGALQLLGGGLGTLVMVKRLAALELLDRTAAAASHSVATLHTDEFRPPLARPIEDERAL